MKVYIEIIFPNGRVHDMIVDYEDAGYVLAMLEDDFPEATINYTEL